MAQDLKDTLQLPKTDFPMRAALAQREPARVAHWAKLGLYRAIQARRGESAPVFVLHDGPPFTNGDVHIGTALNKTLKDVILRYKALRGFRTPFVPGWDCHGLPIEQKVARAIQEKQESVPTAELRARCDAFAEEWIGKQRAQFQRLGVLADWANEYKTKAPAFEADILRTFAAFVEAGLVYRSKKPVYWSIPFETALAEAEVEYKPHASPAVWVRFPVPPAEAGRAGLPADKPLSVVIWTTTPWTLPANLAIALHPEAEYAVADLGAERILVARALLGAVAAAAKLEAEPAVVHTAAGARLEGLQPRHPFIDRPSPVVLADYVTTDSGTGAVHTAPGHGAEDYQTGLKYGLEIYCPVGDDGRYLDDGRVPAELVGLTTLESVEDLEKKRTSPANVAVLKLLDARGALLAKQRYEHSYPHCWRSKTPIIFRAVDQWFVGLDRAPAAGGPAPRARALEAIGEVRWIPAWGESRIRGAVESRPDWCVSRQRAWGVPIPAFYDAKKRPYLDAGVVRAVADKIARHGSNLWYDAGAERLLEGVALPAGWPAPAELSCGRDTLDVWLDSGSSHAAVLRRGQGATRWPADLYLEGSDQHRGWFQSSLWTSVVAYGAAPYRAVLTHGFIVDADRKKISKSSTYEKPQTSDAYVAEHGADVIRLWIASQDFRDDIPISKEILSHVSETYRQVRNTFRFQLANLFDFDPARDAVPAAEMDALDRWALQQAAVLVDAVTAAYEASEFHRVYQLCNQFCAVTLSATYHDILKDRLYTLGSRSAPRRSSQSALDLIFRALARLLAPVIPFTTDEAWSFATARREYADDSVHLQDWPEAPAAWRDAGLEADFAVLLRLRTRINEAIEPRRAAGQLGKSLDASVALAVPPGDPAGAVLERHRGLLAELFIVSHVSVEPLIASHPPRDPAAPATGVEAVAITVRHSQELDFIRCPRCWRWVPGLDSSRPEPVCSRCVEALDS
ncbi:MAG TPA: isoleucine--tRNA ligase [Opitutaceae bacterium]|nr:isoleucine--tRNA ligase [Opitutaceae bacterium]